MRRLLPLALLCSSLALPACSGRRPRGAASEAPNGPSAAAEHPAGAMPPLSRELAAIRSHQVGHVSYVLWFGLDAEQPEFQGRVVMNFDLRDDAKRLSSELPVDFEGGTIRSLSVNGAPLEDLPARYDGHRLRLKTGELRGGLNRVEIAFTQRYSTTGNGLERFEDPADHEVYLYSNLEPYSAHRIFPCFDQPDLKASYELTVEAPADWQVVSNTMEREVEQIDSINGRKSWAFPPSPALSTYLFALIAGPYHVWKADADGIPLRLLARDSLAKYVDAPEWFETTRKGLDYYSTEFGYPYPYAKYDQILVPDFNEGAMENAAAVTFSESYVFRSKVTRDRRAERADTILHEMAHMWFGDLVTMRWWNGLWLNESFATFSAAGAAEKAAGYKSSWESFFSGMKEWAYWEDQLVTTHPIESHVPDTDYAFAHFDGITYGKGASVLKQLRYFMGEDDFREGLQRYFQHFALRNTTIADFMRMLSEASGRNLVEWQREWLQTPGVDTVRAEWSCDPANRRLVKLSLEQTAKPGQILRAHKTRVALFAARAGAPDVLDVTYSGAASEIPEAVGHKCPELVFPNYGDYDYVKVELDPRTLDAARSTISKVADDLTRQMLWHSLWDMVVDGKLPPQRYIDLALAQTGPEHDTILLSKILSRVVNDDSAQDSAMKFLPDSLRAAYGAKTEKFLRQKLEHAPSGSDLQLVWYHAFLRAASQPASLRFVEELLSGKRKLPGLRIEQDRRWELLSTLSRAGYGASPEGIMSQIQDELKRDATDVGRRRAIEAEAMIPDEQSKHQWFSRIARAAAPADAAARLSNAELREAIGGFHPLGQEKLSREFIDSYFDSLSRLSKTEDESYLSSFARGMFPAVCDSTVAARARGFLQSHPGLPASVTKALEVRSQEEDRCVRARALSLSQAQ